MAARHTRPRTGDQSLVREINLSLIMNQLREHAPISRANLAEITGLNKTTVSSLVQELITHHFVHEVGYNNTGVGRPAMLLELNPSAGCVLSAEIGVDFINVVRSNFAAEVEWHQTISTDPAMSQHEILDKTLALLHQAAARCGELLGIALGVPGLVDQQTGTLIFAPNLDWQDVPLGAMLRQTFEGVPVFIDNEANLAALGEQYFGTAKTYNDVLYISVGVGLGGGMVRGGQLFRGKAGFAGEFGHMTLDPEGRPCNCGNRGCWETLVSQAALYREIEQAVETGQPTLLTELTGGDLSRLTIPLVCEAAEQGDAVTLASLEKIGRDLGLGMASLINALDPELVVFGGILSLASDFLLPTVKAELQARAICWETSPTEVVPAYHGANACVMGGIATVIQAILTEPKAMAR